MEPPDQAGGDFADGIGVEFFTPLQWSRLTRQAETMHNKIDRLLSRLLQWSRLTRQAETRS